MKPTRLVVALLCLVAAGAAAQTPVGEITSASGFVEIDAFGVGEFVDVRVPEAVYESSVIRTDYESWAYLELDGNEHTIGPSSTTPVSSFVNKRRSNRGDGFFARVLREITRSLSPPEEEAIVAGGRASNQQQLGTSWVFDVDPNELFDEGLAAMDASDFEYAVESFRLIEYPSDGDFGIEEYYVNLSYALMGLGDFHAAMSAAFEYLLLQPTPENAAHLTPRLQLLAGVSAFYGGETAIAEAAIAAYLDTVPLEDAAAEAVVLRHALLTEAGRRNDAEALLARAVRAQPGTDWSALTGR